ncbi:bifunctional folylpolyglutamate synthase/dihydrofolate synthase [Pedobacter sp. SD-b]|uniref:Dihydrofolate synthase/folylpolyglutamate synthase n=1 Tax=Pedobacter segetis TaxID=2793069 RepID=A0ABS1BHJ0_9SPHI|nr:folylpolyglutamate synthase/dihydrofolate synthase family protein [Pedobacter segetis]MBK0382330.1 bifunctional folylpolyglutamate synthase/dihydrofolate synthase [Pedobacter segetis]
MDYQQTLSYLYAKLPMFTRVGISAFKKDLDNTLKFCHHLHHPEKKFKSVHIGGTNGKGSTSHILAAILQKAGYKTGLYTSPHLKDFRERIKINGEMISEQEVVAFVEENQTFIDEVSPSFFEATVALAFQHFAKHQVDVAIIEVGLGGRLDSTNVINPIVSVITNIGLDHVDILGDTLQKIAFEKAGIIKKNVPVVIGEYQEEVKQVFEDKAKEQDAPLIFATNQWCYDDSKIVDGKREIQIHGKEKSYQIALDLTGTYQIKNIKTVLSTINQLKQKGFKIDDDVLISAFSQVKKLTGLMGRWQTLSEDPLIICDTGHNEDGIKEVLNNINETKFDSLHFVIGMVKDKDISKVLSLLPANATYYFCAPKLERAKPADQLKEAAAKYNLKGLAYADVETAIKAAQQNAKTDDLIFIGGSTFVVAEAL